MPSPAQRARKAAAQMDSHRAALARLADERAGAVREMVASGMSQTAIAKELGVSQQAVAKILGRKDAPADQLGDLGDNGVS